MTRRLFVMACCVLLSATSMFAQSKGDKAKADPVSGTWTGELAPPGRRARHDGAEVRRQERGVGDCRGVSEPGRGETGTFDPKTGALKLQLGKKGDSAVLLTLDGTVAKGTATGRVSGEVTGEFTIKKK